MMFKINCLCCPRKQTRLESKLIHTSDTIQFNSAQRPIVNQFTFKLVCFLSQHRQFLLKSLSNYEAKKASLENIRILPLFLFSLTYILTASFDFRPKSGADDRILQISLDGTQGIRHVKAKVRFQ